MDIKKKLIEIIKCPICKNKKFTELGKAKNVHKDLKDLFNLFECINCKHWFLSKMPKEDFLNSLYKNESLYVFGSFNLIREIPLLVN